MRTLSTLAILALAGSAGAAAQSLKDRVTRAPDGEVRLAFAARDGICGDGATFIRDLNRDNYVQMNGSWNRGDNWRNRPCEEGPVRVSIRVRDHQVTSSRVYVGGDWSGSRSNVTDLGQLPAAAAARGLVDLVRTGSRSSDNLIFPATLADSVTLWPELLEMARDRSVTTSARKSAVFWVSQAAGDRAAEGLARLADDDDEDREVRESAVFGLSQLPKDEGVPILIRVAKTSRDPKIRRSAMFWLGQSEDPRALDLFEELLTKPGR
ncbi:MAG: HEAT repeat domain-containing protein [Gemmatimonadales bacterium]